MGNIHKPLYNTVRCNKVLDITQCTDGSQKCKDYIEKMTINFHFSICSTHFCFDITRFINTVSVGPQLQCYREVVVYI